MRLKRRQSYSGCSRPSAQSSIDEGIESATHLTPTPDTPTTFVSSCTALSPLPQYLKLLSRSQDDLSSCSQRQSMTSFKRYLDRDGHEIPIEPNIRVTSGRSFARQSVKKQNHEEKDTMICKTSTSSSLSCIPIDDSSRNDCTPPPTYSQLFTPSSSSSVKQIDARLHFSKDCKNTTTQSEGEDKVTEGGC